MEHACFAEGETFCPGKESPQDFLKEAWRQELETFIQATWLGIELVIMTDSRRL